MKKLSEIPTFRAFRSLNYSLYFVGRGVSQFGTWMQRTAVVWVVYSITHSPMLLGLTIFAEQFPSFLLSIPGGVAADRYDRYKIIKIMQVASIIQSVALAVLVITGHAPVWAILALSVMLGVINAFDVPARQSMIHEVVADPADLPNALSLTTAMASLAQLLGPALAGIVLSAFGAAVCFFINAASFVAVIISLLLMKLPVHKPKTNKKRVLAEFAEGFSYLRASSNLSFIILFLCFTCFLVLPYNTVLPIFAKEIFKGNASTFGYISSFIGVGAVSGTIFLASRKAGAQLRHILFVATLLLGVGLICFSLIKSFPIAMVFAILIGFGAISQFAVTNIIVQSESAPEMRGRTIGVLLMAMFGMVPLGSLVVGAISERIGAPTTVLCQGIVAIIVALSFSKFLKKRNADTSTKEIATEEPEEAVAELYND
ncbi:MAG: MFS transporter [Bacteroidetes bacterium]|nr:MFS transporter [Bacteroidota bacterium]